MTVYVDNMHRIAEVGLVRDQWCHLFADSSDELQDFALLLGLRREWLQHQGTYREHYDVTTGKRRQAIRLGAVAIAYPRETGALLERKRKLKVANESA